MFPYVHAKRSVRFHCSDDIKNLANSSQTKRLNISLANFCLGVLDSPYPKCPRDSSSLGILAEIFLETSSAKTEPCFPRRPTHGLMFSQTAKELHHQEAKKQRVYQEKSKDF
jgi:hypothetical protein